MHGFHKGLQRRLERLERRLSGVPDLETEEDRSRRHELVRAAHADLRPRDLQEHERETFARIKASVPLVRELLEAGELDAYLDDPGPDPDRDDLDAPSWEA